MSPSFLDFRTLCKSLHVTFSYITFFEIVIYICIYLFINDISQEKMNNGMVM